MAKKKPVRKIIETPRGPANAVVPVNPSPYSISVRYEQSQGIVRGDGADWFGPLNPMAPVAPEEVAGRRFDYITGYNLNQRPRGYEAVGFETMRGLADSYDLLRLVIETRKDQLSRLKWNFSVGQKDKKTGKARTPKPGQQAVIDEMTNFFRRPDGEQRWRPWLRSILEDKFVIDAVSLYCQRNRGGKLAALKQVDGATIKVVLDDWGRTPKPWTEGGKLIIPPAYQQVIKGLPAVNYAERDLMYRPHNRRVNRAYGYSEVEQIIVSVNIALRRQAFQLGYYTEGNVPEALIGAPDNWTPEQIMAFQVNFDAMLQGNLATRRRIKVMPGGMSKTYVPTKEPDLVNPMDEWLARIVCFAFSTSPQQFIKMMNRATAESSGDQAKEEGVEPLKEYICDMMNDLAEQEFGVEPGDVVFGFEEETEVDQLKQQQIVSAYVGDGIKTLNEGRDMLGDEPLDDPAADQPMVKTASGYIPIGSNTAEGKKAMIDAGLAPDPSALTGFGSGDPEGDADPEKTGAGSSKPFGRPKVAAKAKNGTGDENSGKAAAAKAVHPAHAILTAGFSKASRRARGGRAYVPFDRPKSQMATRRIIRMLTAAFKSVAKQAADAVRDDLDKLAKARKSPSEIADDLDMSVFEEMIEPLGDELARAAKDYATETMAMLGVKERSALVDQVNERAVTVAHQQAASLVGKRYDKNGDLVEAKRESYRIDETTRDMIRDAIADGLEENIGTDAIADSIEALGAFSRERAELIANTEVRSANSTAAVEGYTLARDQAGVNVKKEWIITDEACDICQDNADEGSIELEDPFSSGDTEPPAHPNCRCAIGPVVDEETADAEPKEEDQEPTAPGRDTDNPLYDPDVKEETDQYHEKLSTIDFDRLPQEQVDLEDLKSPQRDFEQRKVDYLVENWDKGLAKENPIFVLKLENGDKVIWSGNHRVLAAQELELESLPAKVLDVTKHDFS